MIFKILAFSIVLNIAVGAMTYLIVDSNGDRIFDGTGNPYRGGLNYDSERADSLYSQLNGTVTPNSEMGATEDLIYNVLDKLNIGFIWKFLKAIPDFMFGFVNVLQTIVGPLLDETANNFIFKGITPEIAELSTNLPETINQDPADRIISATSIITNTPLITADKNLLKSNLRTIW